MRRHHYALFFLLLLIAIIIVGWNRGWFTVNKENIQRDEQQLKEKAEQIKEGIQNATKKGAPSESPSK